MTDDTTWDYSHIPERKWNWHFEEDHWMDLELGPSGLNYYGTDYTCLSGGGYFGGFQTFDEFLSKNSIQKMPDEIQKEVKEYIEKYRRKGGASLQLHYELEITGYCISGVFMHLDGEPIHVKYIEPKDKILLYDGSITQGHHIFSFIFVLRSETGQKKVEGEIDIAIKAGMNRHILRTTLDDDDNLVTSLVEN